MLAHPHQKLSRRLKERVDYFFNTGARSRTEVADFAERMRGLGQVGVVGGMLRNLLLEGNRDFVSDVDFVVDCVSIDEFQRTMTALGAKQNRFGGFGVSLRQWKVDVWPLERTWAAMEGHVEIKELSDLIKTTFFNWDEIIYELEKHELIAAPRYFEWLEQRFLEINLEANPNPLGNAVRAIRYAWRWNAVWGPQLTKHVYTQLSNHGWDKFVSTERQSFANRVLEQLDGFKLLGRLSEHVQSGSHLPLQLEIRPYQAQLPFN